MFREFTERLRWSAQFYGRSEQAAVVGGLWRERELRVRLAELHRYRLAGVTRLEECAHYEQHAAHRKHPHAPPAQLHVRTPYRAVTHAFSSLRSDAAHTTGCRSAFFYIYTSLDFNRIARQTLTAPPTGSD